MSSVGKDHHQISSRVSITKDKINELKCFRMNRSRASFNVQESFIADSLVLFLIWHSGARGIKLQEINGDWLIGSSTCNNAAGQQLIWCHPGHYRSDVCSASKGPSLQCRSSTVGWYWLNTGCTRRCTVAKTVGNWALPTLHSTVLQLPQSYHIVSDTIHISNIYISYLILESGRCQHCTLLLYHPPLSFCAQD